MKRENTLSEILNNKIIKIIKLFDTYEQKMNKCLGLIDELVGMKEIEKVQSKPQKLLKLYDFFKFKKVDKNKLREDFLNESNNIRKWCEKELEPQLKELKEIIEKEYIKCTECEGIGNIRKHSGYTWITEGKKEPTFIYEKCPTCDGQGKIFIPEEAKSYISYIIKISNITINNASKSLDSINKLIQKLSSQ